MEDSKRLGLDPGALDRLVKTIEKDIAGGLYDGAVFIVARNGEIALHESVVSTERPGPAVSSRKLASDCRIP